MANEEQTTGEGLLSVNEAAACGIERLRRPIWAHPMDHIKIDIIDGKPGPWHHLWCPFNTRCNGRDPVSFVAILMGGAEVNEGRVWLPYFGPLPDSAEYRAAVAAYEDPADA